MMKYIFSVALVFLCCFANAQRDIRATDAVKITGDIKGGKTFTLSDLEKYPSVSLGDVSIKNHKGEEKSLSKNVKGILLKNLLDSIGISVEKPKELSAYYFVFIASDNYKNVYSWNEIFNNEIGNRLYIITEKDGKSLSQMEGRIQVLCLSDFNTGRRYLKGLATIEVKRVR